MGGAACAAGMMCEITHRHLQWAFGRPTAVLFGCFDQLTEYVQFLSVGEIWLVSEWGSLCS